MKRDDGINENNEIDEKLRDFFYFVILVYFVILLKIFSRCECADIVISV
jgi:hypothetical protein